MSTGEAATEAALQRDVVAVQTITAVPSILDVVCRATGMGFAAVARVTEGRWIACSVLDNIEFGLQPGGELKVETTLCNEVREARDVIVIDNVSEDALYCAHPTPAMYGFQSYISMPITLPDGTFFGTLCALDPRPMQLKRPEVLGMFKLFAELIAYHLDAGDRLSASEALLEQERQTTRLRDEFIAVLSHDLRNPLGSLAAGTQMLTRTQLGDKEQRTVQLMQGSIARMKVLIDNVMDLARTRLGSGLSLERKRQQIEPVLTQVLEELQIAWPQRRFDVRLAVDRPVDADAAKVAQLFSNLVGNALTHGAADGAVTVEAASDAGAFTLSVANEGEPIPQEMRDQLFRPYRRGRSSPQGLGLGLYIASEIARAHGGTLEVSSDDKLTRFTFRMPMN